jgi:ABC-type transport system involved in cytochrome c biogenesis permease subunit
MMKIACVFLSLTLAALPASEAAGAAPPSGLDLSAVRAIVVQHDGRWMPLDTLARDLVEKATGTERFDGHDPVLLLLAWTFQPAEWMQEPLIPIGNAELRSELELPPDKTRFSYLELLRHGPLLNQIDKLRLVEQGRKLDPLESKVSTLNDKLLWLQAAFNDGVINAVPSAESTGAPWQLLSPRGHDHGGVPEPVTQAWSAMGDAFVAGDAQAFENTSRELVEALAALPAAHRPDAKRIASELRYNRTKPFRLAWVAMAVGTLLSVGATFIQRRWFDALAVAALVAGFAAVTYGLSLRWAIAGRLPAANMYESLLFVGWGMGAFAIVAMFILPHRLVPLSASLMGALALFLTDVLPIDHFIRPIAPVLLDTYWMTIHVPVILVSYSVLAMAVIIAHILLASMAFAPSARALHKTLDKLHYWYVLVGSILLFAGIVTGSMWAASSWGRYWGWDPKEVWSLVACLGYVAILHVRTDRTRVPVWAYVTAGVLAVAVLTLIIPKLGPMTSGKILALAGTVAAMLVFVLWRGPFVTALKSILAFWLIIMTYVGVNFVLGIGLHSYGFGTGAVVRYMFTIGGLDLALVALCWIAYLIAPMRATVVASPRTSPS